MLLASLVHRVASSGLPDPARGVKKDKRFVLPDGAVWIVASFFRMLLPHLEYLHNWVRHFMVPALRAHSDINPVLISFSPVQLHAEPSAFAIPADRPELVALHALLRAEYPLDLVSVIPACNLVEIIAGQSDCPGIEIVRLEPRNSILFFQVENFIAQAHDPHCLGQLFNVGICADKIAKGLLVLTAMRLN